MSKKLVHDVALIATKLHVAGLTFEDAQRAAEYCLLGGMRGSHAMETHRYVDKQASDILWHGFSWSFTPEGHEYWYERANLLAGVDYEH